MSKISFKNFPPPQDTTMQQTQTNPHWFATPMSRWVKDKFTKAFGVVQSNDGNQMVVKWSTGLESVETGENIEPAVATEYMEVLKSFAATELKMGPETFAAIHKAIVKRLAANNIYSMEVLTEFEEDLMSRAIVEVDADYESTWATVEETAAGLGEEDVFTAFGVDSSTPPKPTAPAPDVTTIATAADLKITAGPDGNHPGTFAVFVDGSTVEQFFDTLEEALASIPEWRASIAEREVFGTAQETKTAPAEKPGKLMCALCNNVAVNKNSGELEDGHKICKKCSLVKKRDRFHDGYLKEGEALMKAMEAEQAPTETATRFYVAAFNVGDFILGTGTTISEAQNEAEKRCIDETGFLPEEDIEVFACTEVLYNNVKTYGGECSWTMDTEKNLATTKRREPKSAPVVESQSSITTDTVDTATTVSTTPEKSTEGADAEAEDPKQSGIVAASSENDNVSNEIAPDAQTVEESVTTPIQTEQGLVDPETGEILEPSFILSKLGWTEFPVLTANPTHAELEAFEAKLDQVTDRALGHVERAVRYRAACEARCKPIDGAANFWIDNFVVPLSKKLAPHKLKISKKGNYTSKVLTLPSGCIKFTKQGGAYVHDAKLVADYIKTEGLEKFKEIGAEMVVDYSYRKLISALNKGVLKDIPGTGKKDADHFAKAKVFAPGQSTTQGDEGEDD